MSEKRTILPETVTTVSIITDWKSAQVFEILLRRQFRVISCFQNMEDTLEQLRNVNNTISTFRIPTVGFTSTKTSFWW